MEPKEYLVVKIDGDYAQLVPAGQPEEEPNPVARVPKKNLQSRPANQRRAAFCGYCCFGSFIEREMRLRLTSASSTRTLTISPTLTTCEGCLTKWSDNSEICTSPSR